MIRAILLAVILSLTAFMLYAAPIHDAAKDGSAEDVVRLLESGADIDEVDYLAGSPLHIAAVRGKDRLVDVLLEHGADVDPVEFGNSATPLHWAALAGHINAAERLIAAGANLDARTDFGDTPLIVALENENVGVGRILIEAGADILAENKHELSPIQFAARAEDWALVDLLAEMGARPADPTPVAPYLENADLERGAALWFEACGHCHGSPTRTGVEGDVYKGPPLMNVVGRDIASFDKFGYSAALLREEGVWTYEKLNRFLTNPGAYWPGTKMVDGYESSELNLPDVADRAAMIGYMRHHADPRPPLPDVSR
jgi:ankyrin repeat protein